VLLIDSIGGVILLFYTIQQFVTSEVRKDRAIKMKNRLKISGLNWKSYYLSYFLVEFPIGLILIMITCGFSYFYKGYDLQQLIGYFFSCLIYIFTIIGVGFLSPILIASSRLLSLIGLIIQIFPTITYKNAVDPNASLLNRLLFYILPHYSYMKTIDNMFTGFTSQFYKDITDQITSSIIIWLVLYCIEHCSDYQLSIKEFVLSPFSRSKSGKGSGKEPLVKTVKLSKEYSNLRALNELSLEMNKGEIFTVLGPNGAGKTTFINLILGNLRPTSGEIRIDGKDFKENVDAVRKKIGYCAQETILFDELTVMQHITLFEGIKEVKLSKADEILDKLLLRECKDKEVKTLSGGQKRKLAVGLALIGDLSIIVLDEPTVGMDTDSRQGLWKLILENKANKLILLTTQNLAEADELSDRVAILNNGMLFGKPQPAIEWKKKYGHGYRLLIEANNSKEMKAAEAIVKRHVKDIMTSKKDGERKSEYILPMGDLRSYSRLFEELEKNKELKLSLEYSSLEDAYLNITELRDNKKSYEKVPQTVSKINEESKVQGTVIRPSICMQFLGLLKLRFILLKRNWSRWIDSLLPLLLIFIGSLGYFDRSQSELEFFLEYAVTGIAYFFLTVAYANLLSATIYTPVHEKEKQLKYTLEVNGTKGFTYWFSYILSEIFIALIMIIATHIILRILYTYINK